MHSNKHIFSLKLIWSHILLETKGLDNKKLVFCEEVAVRLSLNKIYEGERKEYRNNLCIRLFCRLFSQNVGMRIIHKNNIIYFPGYMPRHI